MPVTLSRIALLALVLAACLLAPTTALAAGPPEITSTSVSEVTQTSARLSATVDPTGTATKAHFEYTTLAAFEEHGFEGASRLPAAEAEDLSIPAGEPKTISAPLGGLSPASGYVFRAVAKKTGGKNQEEVFGPPTTFYTFGPSPLFAPCANDEYRSGERAASGSPGAQLPDCRSYELATPQDKDGNNALSTLGLARAAVDGSAITFGSPFGIPGGQGAQVLPFYQATRGSEDWSTSGLLAPAALAEGSRFLVGQLPDLSATYASATNYEPSPRSALFELHRDGSAPTQITPFAPGTADFETRLGFAGASADASTVAVQAAVALPAEDLGPPIPGSSQAGPNVYAWDRATGQLHLASVMNSLAQTEAKLAKGAWAGPYNWVHDRLDLEGGTESTSGGYYLSDEHAVSSAGSVFFTSRAGGHLYERINPTAPQSAVLNAGEADEECTEADKACTLDVSASRRAVPDSGGPQPAAFQMATPDGSKVLFTSSQKLTEDANTGPEQPAAQIGRATLNGDEPADPVKEDFLPAHALGLTVDPEGEYVYWAEPLNGTIGRAKLIGEAVGPAEAEFIKPGPTEAELHQVTEPGVITSVPTKPRYVAVGPCAEGGECIYWTNAGPAGEDESTNEYPTIDGEGTIGRARLDGSGDLVPESVDAEFIAGASNPQGIAVDATHVYWANAAQSKSNHTVGRAAIDGGEVEERFVTPFGEFAPYGIALSATHLYFDLNDLRGVNSYIVRTTLDGKEEEGPFIGEGGQRGIALDAGHLYWATQGEGGAIGRISLAEFSLCETNPTCETHFLTPSGVPEGLTSDGAHLLWSVNGEAPGNPGNDLYRYEPATRSLTDLTPKASNESENGAEVRGVLGTSADGSVVYFAANADLDGAGPAQAGNCSGRTFEQNRGECNVYRYHGGEYELVARVATRSNNSSDAVDWLPEPGAWGSDRDLAQKSSWVSADGQTLVFRSTQALTPYDNQGQMELYRFSVGNGIACITCTPSGEGPADHGFENFFLGAIHFPALGPPKGFVGQVQPRLASADDGRVFFETDQSLVASDSDGPGCEVLLGTVTSCLDVYEWEAPGKGSCSVGGPGYSQLNQGCLYLISQNSDSGPAYFADASASGEDVFFFTTARLVGKDGDELLDIYDARVGGGLAAQNPIAAPPCEGEAGCKPPPTQPPDFQAPPGFSGPPNPNPPKHCPKGKVRKQGKCVKKKAARHKKHHHRKGHSKGRAGR
jgi:hypothetical protein